ncbi:MAG: Mur ligase family protein [Microthrixaceae bacterium]
MHPEDLRGRRIVVLGLGIDVRAAIPKLAEVSPAEWLLVDSGSEVATAAEGGVVTVDGVALQLIDLETASELAEVFLRSPGFPRYLEPLNAARGRGVPMTTPVDLFMATLRPDQRVVAVTGTKGKSTTTDLVGHFLADAGVRAGIAGNLGIPVFADGWDSEAPIVVIEVSSYQASDLHHVPDIAVLTSLSEDHLSWHGGVERYVADKLRVVSNESGTAPIVIVSADEPGAIAAVESQRPVVVKSPPNPDGLPFQRVQNAALAAEVLRQLGVTADAGASAVAGADVDAGPSAGGGGDASEIAGADARSGVASMTEEQILAGAAATMPGRLDPCPTGDERWQGVSFIDDTLASNPSAAGAGLRWARSTGLPTVVILGGSDRGVSVAPLLDEASLWDPTMLAAVTLPDNGNELAEHAGIASIGAAESVTEAVAIASAWLESTPRPPRSASRTEADSKSDPGRPDGIVLFSPAAPTPARQGSWKNRSADFRSAVVSLR